MIADQPFVSFKKEKKNTKKQMDDLAERWEKKKGGAKGVSDPLQEFKGGKRTSLGEFFKK